MKRILLAALLLVSLLLLEADAKTTKKSCKTKTPCAASLGQCPSAGCSANNTHDSELNGLKNIKSSDKPVTNFTLTKMMNLEKKVKASGYKQGKPRTVLASLGESDQIRVVGYLLAVKQECGESCNCGLADVDVTTDNHLVLVNPKTVTDNSLPKKATKKQLTDVFHTREAKSVTAEFTPRVRSEGHPNFTSDLQEVLNKTPQGALWVRVTGQQFFDSEHFGKKPLNRATSWEIHPILKIEICQKEKKCKAHDDDNWIDLDATP
ncbi:MAG: hypothetical protein ABI923_03820 [bacterium]